MAFPIRLRIMRLIQSWLLVLIGMLVSATALARDEYAVDVGYAAFFRPGEWTPVNLYIDRQATAASGSKGLLSVETRPLEGDPRQFRKSVDLAAQQHLRISAYVQIPEDSECRIRFQGDGTDRTWPLNHDYLKALKPYERLVLVVSRSGAFVPASGVWLRNTVIAQITPEQLPDIWQALESVDLICFAQDPSVGMPEENKRKALINWLNFGGRILCVGGPATATYQQGFLAPYLPVTLNGTREAQFISSQGRVRFPVSAMQIKDKAQAMWWLDGAPIAARAQVGAGEMIFCGADLQALGGVDPTAAAFWDSVLYAPNQRPHASVSEQITQSNLDFAFGKAARLPSLGLVFLLLGIYTVLVGPINFYMLRKRRRLEMAWLTIPAIVAVFTIITYLIGSTTKGGLMILREMDLLQAPSGAAEARLEKTISLFSPRKRSYAIQPSASGGTLASFSRWREYDPSFIVHPLGGTKKTSTGGTGRQLVIDESDNKMEVADQLFGQWTSQSYTASTSVSLGGGISSEAVLENGRFILKLQNNSPLPLENALFKVGKTYAALGTIQPGETRQRELAFAGNHLSQSSGWTALAGVAGPFYQYMNTDNLPLQLQGQPAEVSSFLRGKLWNSCFDPKLAPAILNKQRIRPQLIAWVSKSRAPIVLNAQPNEYAYAGMLVQDMPLRIASIGPLQLSDSLTSTEVVNFETDNQMSDLVFGQGAYQTSDGEITYASSPCLWDGRFSVKDATVKVSVASFSGYDVEVACYDYYMRRWQVLGNLTESNQYKLIPQYCSPVDATVFTRIFVKQQKGGILQNKSDSVQIQDVSISYNGVIEPPSQMPASGPQESGI